MSEKIARMTLYQVTCAMMVDRYILTTTTPNATMIRDAAKRNTLNWSRDRISISDKPGFILLPDGEIKIGQEKKAS